MHLRRALLLFAIVLSLAAVAASISRPANIDDETVPAETDRHPAPTVVAGPGAGEPAAVSFDANSPRPRPLRAGRAATVTVQVEMPGMVEIPSLGLSSTAEAVTPARFDVLVARPGRYPIRFAPADGNEARPAGTLVVRSGDA